MFDLNSFAVIDNKMTWKSAAMNQLTVFRALDFRLGGHQAGHALEVVSSHTSKSIELPVIKFTIGSKQFFIRDNFYDYNLCVVSEKLIMMPLPQFMEGIQKPLTWEWYLGGIAKCRGYTWDYFTDEEMEDPRILRVFKKHKHTDDPNAKPMEWSVRAEEKDLWLKRMTSPEWYSKYWSSGVISWEGTFGPGVDLYVQSRPFMQGIEKVVPAKAHEPYKFACTMFAIALGSIEQVEALIRKLAGL